MDIYLKAVGGEKKRRVYGLGRQASEYYQFSSGASSTAAAGPSQASEDVRQEMAELRAQVQQQAASLQATQALLQQHIELFASLNVHIQDGNLTVGRAPSHHSSHQSVVPDNERHPSDPSS